MKRAGPARIGERGATTLQVLVILVPVLLAFMGFAVDLARIYLVRAELQTAANAAALAAASKLIGTDAATAAATAQAQLSYQNVAGFGNKFDFGGQALGQSEGFLASDVPDPTYYDNLAAAAGSEGGVPTGGAAKYARVTIRADAPLLFFGFLPVGQERKTPIDVAAVAGVSAALCTVCGTEPIAIQAVDASDTTDFGFTRDTKYTFGYVCTGSPTPSAISGTTRVPYLLLNRYNTDATLYSDESSQAYRIGSQGMLPASIADSTSDTSAYYRRACMSVATDESIWVSAAPTACNGGRISNATTGFVCGLALRFEGATPSVCSAIPDADTISALYQADPDLADYDSYASYAGNGRRVITVAVVETLDANNPMQPLGFRQFLVEPNPDSTTLTPNDTNARFLALYIGYPMPVRQGRIDGCTQVSGPGKVVLHQ
jgi:hypothetical protein